MTVAIGDLVAHFRSDTTDLERGGQVAKQTLQAVEQHAGQASRALEIMAQQFAKLHGGSAQQALEMFQRSGAQPTAAALAQAAREMENTAAAAARAVQPTQAAARAASEMARGFEISGSNLLRFAAGITGVGLGISLAAGTARVLHDTIADVIGAQQRWERSLVQVRALYGGIAGDVVTTARAQAALPGVLGTQQEFVQAAISSRYLTTRYGVSPDAIVQMTTAAGRAAGALGITDPQQRVALQQRFLDFAENGGTGLRELGIEGTPGAIARQLGYRSEAALQALTPGQLREAQVLIETYGANRLAATATDPGSLIARRAAAEQVLNRARSDLLTGGPPATVEPLGPELTGRLPGTPYANLPPALPTGVEELERQFEELTAQLGDASKAASAAAEKLNRLGIDAGGATARLLSFTGSLDDRYSIARGDIGAQAQAAVASRARMAIPAFGVTQGQITATATNNAYQSAYQNYVAFLAQNERANPIREYLESVVRLGPANQRAAAQRALDQARLAEPIQARIGQAERAGALIDLRSAETQAGLERIALTQRERYVQLLRDTVDLRRLDVQQQQLGVQAQMDVVRAQQAGLPAQFRMADAQYQINRSSVLAQARLGRLLQGKDVSGFPSLESLIHMNVEGQFAAAEAGPAALEANRAVELAQRTATSRGLAQQLTQGELRYQELGNDLKNLQDLPAQTALELELVQNNRDQLAIQKETRDLMKDFVRIASGRAPSLTSGQGIDEIATRVAAQIFGPDESSGNMPLPDLPGNRRGPF